MYFSGDCSHIINIFDKEDLKGVKNPTKGNLYLSGVYQLQSQGEIKKAGITCVLTIIDRYTYQSFKVPNMLKKL
jgi:hypothetical protein